ncbi:MAG: DUF309 domain-containing protein [Solirubrobacterales bacterium]
MPQEATGKTGKPSETRNKPERPRDHLGRPQPWGTPNTLELEDYDALPLEDNHALARADFAAGRFFRAHEAWETAWKQARDTEDAELFKGLSQLGAGYVHLLRGNAHGAVTLLGRAASRIGRYPEGHRGMDCPAVARAALAEARRVERGELEPGEDARVRPPRV